MVADLAFANLTLKKTKTAISMAGVATSIVLIFMQLGFRGAVENTATTIYDELEFDLLVRSPDYLHVADPSLINRSWLRELRQQPGIVDARPMYVGMGSWTNPIDQSLQGVLIMGIDPHHSVFRIASIDQQSDQLIGKSRILIDQKSSPSFGPANGIAFGDGDYDVETLVNGEPVRIAGMFELGAGLTANGSLIVGEDTFGQLFPIPIDQQVSMVLLRIDPKFDAKDVRNRIESDLVSRGVHPDEIDILTRSEVRTLELRRWIQQTPIGFIFTLGVVISFLVGSAIVYSVMSNDVNRRIGEFATLKAMGYSNGFVCSIVIRQAIYLGVLAFIPSLFVSLLLYGVTGSLANIPIAMTTGRAAFVLFLSLSMSTISGLASLRRVWSADPAALF